MKILSHFQLNTLSKQMNYYFFLALLICTGRTAPECFGRKIINSMCVARKSIKAKVFISILHYFGILPLTASRATA